MKAETLSFHRFEIEDLAEVEKEDFTVFFDRELTVHDTYHGDQFLDFRGQRGTCHADLGLGIIRIDVDRNFHFTYP